jgi:hypothetical protein
MVWGVVVVLLCCCCGVRSDVAVFSRFYVVLYCHDPVHVFTDQNREVTGGPVAVIVALWWLYYCGMRAF